MCCVRLFRRKWYNFGYVSYFIFFFIWKRFRNRLFFWYWLLTEPKIWMFSYVFQRFNIKHYFFLWNDFSNSPFHFSLVIVLYNWLMVLNSVKLTLKAITCTFKKMTYILVGWRCLILSLQDKRRFYDNPPRTRCGRSRHTQAWCTHLSDHILACFCLKWKSFWLQCSSE